MSVTDLIATRRGGFLDLSPERLAESAVLIAGAGNIGSHLAPLVARAGFGAVCIVDRDRVEAKNLDNQDYRLEDVGRFKAEVLVERLQRQFPARRFTSRACDLEDLPLAEVVVDLVFGCLDSRRARQALISEMAWPLGVPVIDGGVGDNLLGRVQAFVPSSGAACLECTWGKQDYRLLAAEYPCQAGSPAEATPTLSSAFAGNFVASVMLTQGLRVFADRPMESWEIAFDPRHDVYRRFALRRSTTCRHDHEVIADSPRLADGPRATVAALLAVVAARFGDAPIRLECRRDLPGLKPLGATRFATVASLRQLADQSLETLGFVPGDRVRVTCAGRSIYVAL